MGREKHYLPDRNTQSYTILELIAVSGDFPADLIYRLAGGSRYKEERVKLLKAKKLIRTYNRDKLRSYRLTVIAKKHLLLDRPDRFIYCLTGKTETNQLKSEKVRRLRLHRIAETLVTMHNAAVAIFCDEKPDVFSPVGAQEKSTISRIHSPAFYHSREIKEFGTEFVKIRGARSVGTLLSEDTAFVVYNMGDALLKWGYKSEMRTKALIKTILLDRMPDQYSPDSVHGLLLGNRMELAYQLLTDKESIKTNYFILDGNYEHFHFITNDHHGELLLKLLCTPEKVDELNRMLSAGLYERDPGSVIENDAIDEDNNPVLFAHSFDMPKIVRFRSAIQLHNRIGTMICFDFQSEVLRRYCGDSVKIQTIDFEKFERRFFQ